MTSKDKNPWEKFIKLIEPFSDHLRTLDAGIQQLNTRIAAQEKRWNELEKRLMAIEQLLVPEIMGAPPMQTQLDELREFVKDLQEQLEEAWDELRERQSS